MNEESKNSKELFDKLLPIVESFEDSDTETLDSLVDELMKHFGYKEFPISGFNKMKQLGYLFQQLEIDTKKEIKEGK